MNIRLTTESGYTFGCRHWLAGRTAETVVALHGFGGSGADFEHLAALRPQWNWLAPDWFGHGRSPLATVPACDFLEAQLQLLDAVVQSVDGPLRLLAYSMGGRIALHYLVRAHRPTIRVAHLIGVSPGLSDPAIRAERWAADQQWATVLRRDGLAAFRRQWSRQAVLQTRLDPASELGQRIEASRAAQDPDGLATCIDGMSPGRVADLWLRLGAVQQPVHLIVGAEDQKFLEINRRMLPLLPHGRLTAVANAGHAVHLDEPEECLEVVEGWTVD